jgi:hypothetical protein
MVIYNTRPFAYNPGSPISGTTQCGDLAIGDISVEYSDNYGGVKWWMGPDEDLGYVIAYPVPSGDHPTQVYGTTSYVGFYGTKIMNNPFDESTFVELTNSVFNQNFTTGNDASNWLTTNGFWNSWGTISVTPTPTPTGTSAVTPTPTPSVTYSLTPTPTSTNTSTPTNTPTPSVTTTATNTPTPTPTSTPTNAAAFSVTISEVGSDVVMTATGALNINGLTLVQSNTGPYGGGGLGVSTATYLMGTINVNFDLYSGFTTNPTSFGSGGGGGGASSTSGDVFGVITPGAPPYELVVPVGYTSGTQITSTQTFANQTLSSLGFTNGTYSYTWPGGSFDVIVGAPSVTPTPTASSVTPTPTPTIGGGGMGSWYFYYTEGPLTAGPPTGNGNTIFRELTSNTQVFEPNFNNGTDELYFCTKDSNGTSFNTQFNNLQTSGGTIIITQGSNSAIFTSPTGNNFVYNPGGGGGQNGFLLIRSSQNITQTQTCSKFNGTDPISLSFS